MEMQIKRFKWKRSRNMMIQNQLSLIYNSVSDLVFLMEVLDENNIRCVSVNQTYVKLTGIAEEQLIGKTIWEFLPHQAACFANSKYQEVLRTQTFLKYQEKVKLFGGEIIAETRLYPICNERGRVTHLLGVSQDVTEKIKTQIALVESEQWYRDLMALSPDGILVSNQQGMTTFVNQKTLELYEATQLGDLVGKNGFDFIHPEDREIVVEKMGRDLPLKRKNLGPLEMRILTSAGNLRYIETTATTIQFKEELSLLVIIRDITERKRLQEDMRQSQDRMHCLMNIAKIGRALMDVEGGRILETDPILQNMFGYSEEELRNQSFSMITYPEDTKPNMVLYQELIEGKRDYYQMEKRYIRKDGTVMWGNLTVSILGRNPLSIMAMVEDITDRKQMENKLRVSEEKYRLIAENMSDFISVFDTNEKVLYASPSHKTHLGLNLEKYVGSVATPYIHPTDLEEVRKSFHHLLQNRCAIVIEFRWKHADGHWVTLEARGEPVMNEKGEIQQVVIVSRDITERKKVEKKLREANEVLKNLSQRDGLTGISNRRYFDEILQREGKRASRESSPLSLILLDIDFFKLYNDTYGHQGGDDCLRKVAGIIENELKRPGDFVARYGGEEFAVILPRTDQEGALHVAERIRDHIEKLQIPHSGSKMKPFVTVSIGVATQIDSICPNLSQLVEQADQALYKAKEQGRNLVSFYQP